MHNRRLAALQRPDGQASSRHRGAKAGHEAKDQSGRPFIPDNFADYSEGLSTLQAPDSLTCILKSYRPFLPGASSAKQKKLKTSGINLDGCRVVSNQMSSIVARVTMLRRRTAANTGGLNPALHFNFVQEIEHAN
jgi:hypothetical protein